MRAHTRVLLRTALCTQHVPTAAVRVAGAAIMWRCVMCSHTSRSDQPSQLYDRRFFGARRGRSCTFVFS
jgi:hypothetical protein